jgi:hypothetical protein
MASVCREFGISRPTGYKVFNRYKNLGLEGLIDRSRRPYRQAIRLPFHVERTIVSLRKEHPTVKIREKLLRDFPIVPAPAKSTGAGKTQTDTTTRLSPLFGQQRCSFVARGGGGLVIAACARIRCRAQPNGADGLVGTEIGSV